MKFLGHHATEEASAQAYDNYAKDGVVPAMHRAGNGEEEEVAEPDERLAGLVAALHAHAGTRDEEGQEEVKEEVEEEEEEEEEQEEDDEEQEEEHDGNVFEGTSTRVGGTLPPRAAGTSHFKGVYWDKRDMKW